MGEAVKSILHNPICLMVLSMGGIWILVSGLKKVHKKFLKNSKKLKKLFVGIKSFFIPNHGLKSFKDFKQELPFKLKRNISSAQHYLHINLSGDEGLIAHTQYEHFYRQFYPTYMPKPGERYVLDDHYFIYEIGNDQLLEGDKIAVAQQRRLWKKIFQRGTPSIIFTLNLKEFMGMDEGALSSMSQNLRNKIDMLQKLKRKRLPLYLRVSGLSDIKGGEAYHALAEKMKFSAFEVMRDENDLHWQKRFQDKMINLKDQMLYRSENSQDFAEGILFVDNFVATLQKFVKLSGALEYQNKVTITPKVLGLFLENRLAGARNILQASYHKKPISVTQSRVIGTVLAAGVLGFLGVKFVTAMHQVDQSYHQVNDLGESLKVGGLSIQAFADQVATISGNFDKSVSENDLNSVFPKAILYHAIHKSVANNIYQHVLLPLLYDSSNSTQVAFLLLIIHSQTNPELKAFVEKYVDTFASISGAPLNLVQQYLKYNEGNHLVELKGRSIQELPLLNTQTLYDDFTKNLKSLYYNPDLTMTDITDFYRETYYQFAGQSLLKSAVVHYYGPLNHKLSKSEISFFQNLIELLGKRGNAKSETQELALIENIKERPTYNVPEVKNFSGLMGEIREVLTKKSLHEHEKLFLKGQNAISSSMWEEMLARAKINTLVSHYFKQGDNGFVLNTQSENQNDSLGVTSVTASGLEDVDAVYSISFIQNVIVPDITAYHDLLTKMKSENIDTIHVHNLFKAALSNYTNHYVAAYQGLISHFSVHANSVATLQVLLHQLTGGNSPLAALVSTINQNTIFDKKMLKYEFIDEISGQFSAFHEIKGFSFGASADDSVKESRLQNYVDILSTFSDQLLLASETGEKAPKNLLSSQALSIYLNDQNSFMKIANESLDKIKMPVSQRKPFLQIFSVIYDLGIKSVQAQLQAVWHHDLGQLSSHIEGSFPFDMNAKESITPEQLTALLQPKNGFFWQKFNKDFSKFVTKTANGWSTKSVLYAHQLDLSHILNTVNKFEHLSHHLWDESGKPQAFPVTLSALPFNKDHVGDAYLEMTFFSVDGESVEGVNNQPVPQQLRYQWWKEGSASVGFVMKDQKSYELSQNGYWAFYKLLKMASSQKNTLEWEVALQKSKVSVRFQHTSAIFLMHKEQTHV